MKLSEDDANFFSSLIPSQKSERGVTSPLEAERIRGWNACRAETVRLLNKHV